MNFDVDCWVHANCALFSDDVKELMNGELSKFIQTYKKASNNKCDYCMKYGASIYC